MKPYGEEKYNFSYFTLVATLRWIVSLTLPPLHHPSPPPVMHWTRVDVYSWFSLLGLMQDILVDNKDKDKKNIWLCYSVWNRIVVSLVSPKISFNIEDDRSNFCENDHVHLQLYSTVT